MTLCTNIRLIAGRMISRFVGFLFPAYVDGKSSVEHLGKIIILCDHSGKFVIGNSHSVFSSLLRINLS